MEVKNAIRILKSRSEFVADINIDAKIAYKMAIETLEKQIPEKPIQQNNKVNNWYECGKCDHIVSEITDRYCPHCGGKIEWE